jgi:hypothetical protein
MEKNYFFCTKMNTETDNFTENVKFGIINQLRGALSLLCRIVQKVHQEHQTKTFQDFLKLLLLQPMNLKIN